MTTITVPRAVLEQVLEALIHMCHNTLADKGYDGQLVQDAIDNLRAAQQEQEPVAYTGDVARRMREAGMTFHLGMPHAVVMEQMTRFHDIVCAEASIKAAAAFAHPPRRETEQEPVAWTDRELQLIDGMIEVQLRHASQCDGIANRTMAEKQKGWDMERVALLQKIKSNPPRREWQSLSEEEINELSHTMVKGHKSVNWLARAIEAKLKEKNQ
jgi:hypothetical protein